MLKEKKIRKTVVVCEKIVIKGEEQNHSEEEYGLHMKENYKKNSYSTEKIEILNQINSKKMITV